MFLYTYLVRNKSYRTFTTIVFFRYSFYLKPCSKQCQKYSEFSTAMYANTFDQQVPAQTQPTSNQSSIAKSKSLIRFGIAGITISIISLAWSAGTAILHSDVSHTASYVGLCCAIFHFIPSSLAIHSGKKVDRREWMITCSIMGITGFIVSAATLGSIGAIWSAKYHGACQNCHLVGSDCQHNHNCNGILTIVYLPILIYSFTLGIVSVILSFFSCSLQRYRPMGSEFRESSMASTNPTFIHYQYPVPPPYSNPQTQQYIPTSRGLSLQIDHPLA